MNWEKFWEVVQSPLVSAILAGLIVAVVITVVPKLRRLVFGAINRLGRFVGSLRIITTTRLSMLEREALASGASAQKDAEARVKAAEDAAELSIADERANAINEYKRGYDARQSELDIERALPVIQPRWAISKDPKGNKKSEWVLANFADGSVAKNVSIDAPSTMFVLTDKGQWDDLSGKNIEKFKGYATEAGQAFNVTFTIEWTDQHGDRWTKNFDAVAGNGYGY